MNAPRPGGRMENWIIRAVAALCAAGSAGLFWTLGVFLAVPLRTGRWLALDRSELQLIVVPLLLGSFAAWGALHIVGLADRDARPRTWRLMCALLVVALLAAAASGLAWTTARLA